MAEIKVYTIGYTGHSFQNWANLGDDIQTVAAKRLLPQVDGYISREALSEAEESGVISLNGFFLGEGSWPPSGSLEPFFYAFHIAAHSQEKVCSAEGLRYLRKYQPIGCRDRGTMDLLAKHGIEAFYSKCVSLTFEKRQKDPDEGVVFLVGLSKAAESVVPRKIRERAVVVDQPKLRLPSLSHETREQLAEHLLDTYAKRASLVITSKIHCAMPCIAMGIPVVFLYDKSKKNDYRVEIIRDFIGINYVDDSWVARKITNRFKGGKIDWSPGALDIEKEKELIRSGYLREFQKALDRFSERTLPCPS